MSKWIKIGDPTLKGNKVENKITSSDGMRKYLKYSTFYAKYDEELEWNPSILNIPAVASLITLAWLTGAVIKVNDLDKKFADSMKLLYDEYNGMYPEALPGQLRVKRAHVNKSDADGLALFFSGGLDSTYSLYRLRDKSPRLIMIGGFDVYMDKPRDEAIWKKWKKTYGEFAEREGLKLNFIRTNSRALIREHAVDYNHRNKLKLSFWDALRHAPLLIGLAAPLSKGRFNKLVISASRTPEQPTTKLPYSSAPNTDEKVAWADLKVTHYGQIHRYEKIKALLDPLRAGRITFKTCFKLHPDLNCSHCEKCGRVIAFLLAEGVDPNTCGFHVDDDTLKEIRRRFEKFIKWNYRMKLHWVPWIKDLPEEVPDLYGIREFVTWMRDFKYQGVNTPLKTEEK